MLNLKGGSGLESLAKKYNAHRFTLNGNHYILDCVNMYFSPIDELTDKVFECIENKTSPENIYQSHPKAEVVNVVKKINQLASKKIFFIDSFSYKEDERIYKKCFISFPPVHACNLRCKYCFASHGTNYKGEQRKFEKDMLKKALEFIYFELFPECESYRVDFVSGGEPLLNYEMIEYVNDLRNYYQKTSNKWLDMWLCTNGTLLDENILSYLNKNNIKIGMSIDGPQKLHDYARVDENGEGTYDTVKGWIQHIVKSPNYSRALKEIWGLVVITNHTESLVDILKHHKEIGLKSVQMKIVRSAPDQDYAINSENLDRVKEMYVELIEFFKEEALLNNSIDYLCMILNDNDFLGKIVRRLLLKELFMYRCGAGRLKVSIAQNGDIYPCDSFVGMDEFKLGNISTGINHEVREKFYNATVFNRKKCAKCWAKFICGGDCLYQDYIINKDIYEPYNVHCELIKYTVPRVLELLWVIQKNNLKLFKQLDKFMKIRDRLNS